MTPSECGAIVKYMLAGFPAQRQRMRDEDVTAMTAFYFAGLVDIEADAAKKAIERLGRTAKFIPTVADIREAVGVVHHGEQAPSVIAWGEVHKLMGSKGAYRTPGVDFQFSDPLTAEVVRSIGWEAMCTGAPDHIRSRFMDGYEQLAKQQRKIAAASPGARNAALGSRASADRLERPSSLAQLVAAVKPDDTEEP